MGKKTEQQSFLKSPTLEPRRSFPANLWQTLPRRLSKMLEKILLSHPLPAKQTRQPSLFLAKMGSTRKCANFWPGQHTDCCYCGCLAKRSIAEVATPAAVARSLLVFSKPGP